METPSIACWFPASAAGCPVETMEVDSPSSSAAQKRLCWNCMAGRFRGGTARRCTTGWGHICPDYPAGRPSSGLCVPRGRPKGTSFMMMVMLGQSKVILGPPVPILGPGLPLPSGPLLDSQRQARLNGGKYQVGTAAGGIASQCCGVCPVRVPKARSGHFERLCCCSGGWLSEAGSLGL